MFWLTVSSEIVLFASPGTLWTDSLVRIVRFRHPDALPETLQSVPGLAEPRNRLSLKGFPLKTVVLWRLFGFRISGVSRPGWPDVFREVRNRRFYRPRALLFMTVSYEIVTFAAPRAASADSLVRNRPFCIFRHSLD